MNVTILPPDPRLQGWPVPVGIVSDELPKWLAEDGLVRGSYLAALRDGGWKAIGLNCFQKRTGVRI